MYKVLLCLRYLRTRYIALACIVSMTLGVATMIVVNSVMAGFSSEMRDRIHGILADLIIETMSLDGKGDADRQMALVRQAAGDSIEAMTATVEVYGMLSFTWAGQWITRPITLIGTVPESKAKVGPLIDYLDSYNSVMEGDVEVRPPLRSRDEIPNWSLTAEAMTYRQEKLSWQNPAWPDELPTDSDASPWGDNPFEAPPIDSSESPQGENSAKGATSQPTATPTVVESDDPFANSPFDKPIEGPKFADQNKPEYETDDLAAPLDGRLYIGSGLIEFPYEDPETGKIKMMQMVQPGDDVQISTVTAGRPPEVINFNATVVDVFKSGMSEYDSSLVFCNLEKLQEVRGMIDPQTGKAAITSIQIKLKDYADADEVVKRLRAYFPPGTYSVKTWEQKQGALLAAVEIESAILNVLLFLIIAVAGFGILAIFLMIVVEKTRDIGILKALGASSNGVMSIFLSYGLALGVVGSGVGVVMGLLFVHYINEIELFLTFITGRKVFDETIYYFPSIPTYVNPWMVFWVAVGAMTIAVLASILPARRAARLHPVEALRYE